MLCHAADTKGGSPMPDTGVLRLLTSEQRATGWKRQLEGEKSLGLKKGAISIYFLQLAQAHKSKSTSAARRQLREAGVYRVEGLRRGKHRPFNARFINFVIRNVQDCRFLFFSVVNILVCCVCFPSILDINGRTSRGHTGGRSHRRKVTQE